MPVTYNLIASNTLSAPAATVTFSAIPNTYTDLLLKYSARGDNGGIDYDAAYLRFNGVTSASYSNTNLFVNNATVFANRGTGTTIEGLMDTNGSTTTANTFSNTEIYIPSYTSATLKPISRMGAVETNASNRYLGIQAGLFNNSTTISSLLLGIVYSSNFVAGSTFWLYGIKNS